MHSTNLQVPQGWVESTVGKEFRIVNNKREPINELEREKMRGPYPYYGPTGQVDSIDHYSFDGIYALIGEDGDHFLKFKTLDMTQLVSGQFNVNNHAHVISDGERCSAAWFHAYFRNHALTSFLTRQGVGRYKLTKAALETLPVLVPPKMEQDRICQIIAAWDQALLTVIQTIEVRKLYRRGLLSQMLTCRRRFPKFSDAWRKVVIGDYLSESRLPGTDGKLARKLSVRLYGLGVYAKEERILGSENTKYYTRRSGQFIYSKLDFLNGAFGIIPPHLDYYESTLDLPCFDFRPGVEPKFLLALVSQKWFYKRYLGQAMGGRKARRVNPVEFLNIEILLPSKEEQQRIVEVIEGLDQELRLLENLLGTYKQQKKGLMQQLLRGKRRVTQ